MQSFLVLFFFFFNDTATTEIYTLSLHDALPISLATHSKVLGFWFRALPGCAVSARSGIPRSFLDRKSTRLNSSHSQISYAVFCLKKKKQKSLLTHRISLNLETAPTTRHQYRLLV